MIGHYDQVSACLHRNGNFIQTPFIHSVTSSVLETESKSESIHYHNSRVLQPLVNYQQNLAIKLSIWREQS